MHYTFDLYGRFSETSEQSTERSTSVAPQELTSDYNWTGTSWVFAKVPEQFPTPVPTPPTAEEIQSLIIQAVQLRLDTFAQSRNYDSILSASTYATSAILKFQTEGQTAVNARDNTWATLYTILGEVQAGIRPMPTGYVDIEAELPTLEWPV